MGYHGPKVLTLSQLRIEYQASNITNTVAYFATTMTGSITRSSSNSFMNPSFCNSLNTFITNSSVGDSNDKKANKDSVKMKWLLSLLMDSINLTQLYDLKECFELNNNMVQHSNNNTQNIDAENSPRIVHPIVGHHLISIPITLKSILVMVYLSLISSVTL